MLGRMRIALVAVLGLAPAAAARADDSGRVGIDAPPGHVFKKIYSGYQFRTRETRALQDDDLQNPGFLGVDKGAELWSAPSGAAGKSCASCHTDAETSMKGVAARMPSWSERLARPVNLEQQINVCRKDRMQAAALAFKSPELTALTTFVRSQSRGMPVAPQTGGPMAPWFERGKTLYYQRNGQLDLACAHCHETSNGKYLRADFLSQGQSNGFPTYRLRDQKLVPLHERFEGCMFDVRAVPYEPLGDEFVALELYVAWRGIGLPVETPAVRN